MTFKDMIGENLDERHNDSLQMSQGCAVTRHLYLLSHIQRRRMGERDELAKLQEFYG